WSNKRTYKYDYCLASEYQWKACKLKEEIRHQIHMRDEQWEKENPKESRDAYDVFGHVDEFWRSGERYNEENYNCEIVWSSSEPENIAEPFDSPSKLLGERCSKTELRTTKVTIDKKKQIVWFHNKGGLKNQDCEILDYDNYDCGWFNVVDGKPVDMKNRFYK
ncbi:unnamed protein product, partial [marine sediment metagenome]